MADEAQELATKIEALLAGFASISTPWQARERGEELARTMVTFYGSGLERILDIVYDGTGDQADALFAKLTADPLVEGLLCLHGLHPIPVDERVQHALDAVRPYLKSHEGGIEIAGIDDGVVLIELQGSCDGCPSSTLTVKQAVERAILERVPEIREVRAVPARREQQPERACFDIDLIAAPAAALR
ncbi:thioredoxin [Vulcanimicrobium alpinum]|uniref:Thioredoxin n=1 Tax=Vulcanimicrobium alpinum TaxID=3016050 RepID=A0AAN1XY67_UNVUL|nr:NifU family protein [Vulcanimicrobium alpinum]BDE06518.1 thioredoxin [Vulcanimicrobium alpinum]